MYTGSFYTDNGNDNGNGMNFYTIIHRSQLLLLFIA